MRDVTTSRSVIHQAYLANLGFIILWPSVLILSYCPENQTGQFHVVLRLYSDQEQGEILPKKKGTRKFLHPFNKAPFHHRYRA